MNNHDYNKIFSQIKKGDRKAFSLLFESFYQPLCNFAFQYLENIEESEEIAQDIFVKIWEKKSTIDIESSVKSYLFRSIRNLCLNQIQHDKIKKQYSDKIKKISKQDLDESRFFIEPGLIEDIGKAIDSMPEKRKEIFRLSREEGLKYKEIADKLNISVKTVEAQMGLALKYLRKKLKKYSTNYFFLLIF